MRSYYRPDYDAHQASYHRTRRRRTFLALAKRGAVALALGGIVTLAAAAWTSFGPAWVAARLAGLRIFSVDSLVVSGNRTLSRADVVAAAGLRTGVSLLSLDLAAVRAQLARHPWVREASVRRRLPGTVLVEIAERVPCVIVRSDRDLLVDETGAVLAAVANGARADLPVLTGVETLAGALSARGAADTAAGIELVSAIRTAGFPALDAVAAIDLADPDDAVIVPVSGRPLVHAGRRDAVARLRRWRLVAPDMAERWPELEYVDLRAEGQVVALPAEPAPEEKDKTVPAAQGEQDASGTKKRGPAPGAGKGRAAAGGGGRA